jgi:hypothetical protein
MSKKYGNEQFTKTTIKCALLQWTVQETSSIKDENLKLFPLASPHSDSTIQLLKETDNIFDG